MQIVVLAWAEIYYDLNFAQASVVAVDAVPVEVLALVAPLMMLAFVSIHHLLCVNDKGQREQQAKQLSQCAGSGFPDKFQ